MDDIQKRVDAVLHHKVKGIFPFELVQGDCIKRTNPHSAVVLNSGAAWLVSQDGRSAHKVRDYSAVINDMPDIIKSLTEHNKKLVDALKVYADENNWAHGELLVYEVNPWDVALQELNKK